MRTIKFRAWDSDDKEMYDPMVLAVVDNGSLSLSPLRNCKDGNRAYKPYHPLMQFTGLHDKNGKEIYEGDIFKINGKICFVEWNEDMAGFILTTGKGYDTSNMFDFNCDSIYYSEIIGNIHENSELLNN